MGLGHSQIKGGPEKKDALYKVKNIVLRGEGEGQFCNKQNLNPAKYYSSPLSSKLTKLFKGLFINYNTHFGDGLDLPPPMTPMTILAGACPI